MLFFLLLFFSPISVLTFRLFLFLSALSFFLSHCDERRAESSTLCKNDNFKIREGRKVVGRRDKWEKKRRYKWKINNEAWNEFLINFRPQRKWKMSEISAFSSLCQDLRWKLNLYGSVIRCGEKSGAEKRIFFFVVLSASGEKVMSFWFFARRLSEVISSSVPFSFFFHVKTNNER